MLAAILEICDQHLGDAQHLNPHLRAAAVKVQEARKSLRIIEEQRSKEIIDKAKTKILKAIIRRDSKVRQTATDNLNKAVGELIAQLQITKMKDLSRSARRRSRE